MSQQDKIGKYIYVILFAVLSSEVDSEHINNQSSQCNYHWSYEVQRSDITGLVIRIFPS